MEKRITILSKTMKTSCFICKAVSSSQLINHSDLTLKETNYSLWIRQNIKKKKVNLRIIKTATRRRRSLDLLGTSFHHIATELLLITLLQV